MNQGRPLSNEYHQMGDMQNDMVNNQDGYLIQEQQQVPTSNTLHVMSAQAVKRATAGVNSNQQIRASIFSSG